MTATELDWLPSLVAEVSTHLGEPETNGSASRVANGQDLLGWGRRWSWPQQSLTVERSLNRWTVKAAGTRTVTFETVDSPPTADEVRRVLQLAGLSLAPVDVRYVDKGLRKGDHDHPNSDDCKP